MVDDAIGQSFIRCQNHGWAKIEVAHNSHAEAIEIWNMLAHHHHHHHHHHRLTTSDETARLRSALEDVVNPIAKLQRDAEAQGARLSGMAYSIANDLSFVQSIARAALQSQDPS